MTESTERLTTADLLDAAPDAALTARTLEYWRQEGLLPKAERTGQSGKRPQWTYPVQAADQLAALLRLREKTKRPDILRVALWFGGFPIEPSRVRASVAAVLRDLLERLTLEVERSRGQGADTGDLTWQALEQIGHHLAGQRGSNSLPRYARQSRKERDRSMTLMLGLLLADDGASARVDKDAPHLERMLGVHRGRRARAPLPAWLDGPARVGLETFADFASLPALIEAVQAATDDEVQASRAVARVMLDGMIAFSRIADAFAVTDNPAGLAAMKVFGDEPTTAVWMTAFVIAIARSKALDENLRAIVAALRNDLLPLEDRARELAALPPDDLHQRLPGLESLSFIEQVRLKRLIAEYRDERGSL